MSVRTDLNFPVTTLDDVSAYLRELRRGPRYETYTPTWDASSSSPAVGDGTISGKFWVDNTSMFLSIELTMGSTTTFGTGNYSFTIPTGYQAASDMWTFGSGVGVDDTANSATGYKHIPLVPFIQPDATTVLMRAVDASSPPVAIAVTEAHPITWANNDIIRITIHFPYVRS